MTKKKCFIYTVWDSVETLISVVSIFTNSESKETGRNDRQFKITIIIEMTSKSLQSNKKNQSTHYYRINISLTKHHVLFLKQKFKWHYFHLFYILVFQTSLKALSEKEVCLLFIFQPSQIPHNSIWCNASGTEYLTQ